MVNDSSLELYSNFLDKKFVEVHDVTVNDPHSFIRGIFVLLLRGGFILVHLGCIPVENVYLIVLQNIIDITVTVIGFGFLGSRIFTGTDFADLGIFGYNNTVDYMTGENTDLALYGFSAALVGSAILSTTFIGRLSFIAHIVISLCYTTLLQPLVMHWVWTKNGFMFHNKLDANTKVSFKDHGGAVVIHVSASTTGLMCILFLGSRLIRLDDVDKFSVISESIGRTLCGYFFILAGLIAFTCPLPDMQYANLSGVIMINSLMAIGGGFLVTLLCNKIMYRSTICTYWIVIWCIQGSIAGLISISSAIDLYNPWKSFIISICGSLLYFLVSNLIKRTRLEDNCNIIAIHLSCGIISILFPPLLGKGENFDTDISLCLRHLIWQALCAVLVIVIHALFFGILIPVFVVGKCYHNKFDMDNHDRSIRVRGVLKKNSATGRTFPYNIHDDHVVPGLDSKTIIKDVEEVKEEEEVEMFDKAVMKRKSSPTEFQPIYYIKIDDRNMLSNSEVCNDTNVSSYEEISIANLSRSYKRKYRHRRDKDSCYQSTTDYP